MFLPKKPLFISGFKAASRSGLMLAANSADTAGAVDVVVITAGCVVDEVASVGAVTDIDGVEHTLTVVLLCTCGTNPALFDCVVLKEEVDGTCDARLGGLAAGRGVPLANDLNCVNESSTPLGGTDTAPDTEVVAVTIGE